MPTTVNAAAITNGDMIPLLDDAGGGVYTQGRNNARDIRQGLVNILAAANGGPTTRRTGVIPTTYSGGQWTDFRVVGQGSPSTTITVKAGQAILPRTGEGYYLLTMTQDLNIVMNAANGSNPRWDVVCLMGYDKGAFVGDAVHGPYVVIVYGDAAGSPTVPSIPTDAIEITRILRAAGSTGDQIGSVSTPITDKRKSTTLHGGIRDLLAGDALSDAGGYHGERRRRTAPAGFEEAWITDEYRTDDSKWHLTHSLHVSPAQIGNGGVGTPNGSALLANFTVPELNVDYNLRASGSYEYAMTANDGGKLMGIYINLDSTNAQTNVIAQGVDITEAVGTNTQPTMIAPKRRWTSVLAGGSGSHVVRLYAFNFNGAVNAQPSMGNSYSFDIEVTPA